MLMLFTVMQLCLMTNVTRGGPGSGHHVDLLGNVGVLADILAIVSGNGDKLQDEYFSDLARITSSIDFE